VVPKSHGKPHGFCGGRTLQRASKPNTSNHSSKSHLQYGDYVGAVGIDIEASKIASQMLAFTNNISKYLLNRDGVIMLSGSGAFVSSGTDLSKEAFGKT